MSSNCSLVTGPGMSSSSICAESCGRAALPLVAAVLRLRGMKTPLVECYASHTKFLTGSSAEITPYWHFIPPRIHSLTCSFQIFSPPFARSFSFVPSGSIPLFGVAPSTPHSTRGSSKRWSSRSRAIFVLLLNFAFNDALVASHVCCAFIPDIYRPGRANHSSAFLKPVTSCVWHRTHISEVRPLWLVKAWPPRAFSKKSWQVVQPLTWNLANSWALNLVSPAREDPLQTIKTITENIPIFISSSHELNLSLIHISEPTRQAE